MGHLLEIKMKNTVIGLYDAPLTEAERIKMKQYEEDWKKREEIANTPQQKYQCTNFAVDHGKDA